MDGILPIPCDPCGETDHWIDNKRSLAVVGAHRELDCLVGSDDVLALDRDVLAPNPLIGYWSLHVPVVALGVHDQVAVSISGNPSGSNHREPDNPRVVNIR